MALFQTGPDRYRSDPDKFADIDQRRLVLVVGLVALGLPIILWLAAHNPIYETCFRWSISHYYYAPFWGTAFTGAMFFIGTYLMVWQGEEQDKADGKLATRAGLAAFGVALFPTNGWGCSADDTFSARPFTMFNLPSKDGLPVLDALPPEDVARYFEMRFPVTWLSWLKAEWLHYLSALVMFAFLAWFALYVFTRVEDHQKGHKGRMTARKGTRNTIYVAAGIVIILCILALILSFLVRTFLPNINMDWWNAGNWTFWFEAIALVAFGLSWMIKGRLFPFLNDQSLPGSSQAPKDGTPPQAPSTPEVENPTPTS